MNYHLPTCPHSEQFLLACVLRDADNLAAIASELPDPKMFSQAPYRDLYTRMLEQLSAGMRPDMLTLSDEHDIPSMTRLTDILTELPDDLFMQALQPKEGIETHAKLVRDAYIKSQAQLALSRGESAGEVLAHLNTLAAGGHDRTFTAADIADLVYHELTTAPERISLTYRNLNKATSGGIRRGELVVIAARQGGGKSAFMQNVALDALQGGKRVLFVTAEMSSVDMGGRWATILSKQQIMRRSEQTDLSKSTDAIAEMHDWGDRLMVRELVNVAGVEQALKDFPGQIDLVCVDYLQKLSATNPRLKSEYERVSDVSRTLDNLCQRYQVPMLVAAQFNRKAEGQQPSIADLRDSGAIEADADMVISLWQKPGEPPIHGLTKVYLDILKNRNGYTIHNGEGAECALWFDKPHFTFTDMAQQPEVYGHA
jgi:replicative DNA helicase